MLTACVKLANIASQIKIFCHLTCENIEIFGLEIDFSADCSAVAHKAGNFDMFGSRRLVELAGHNIANFLIHFKVKCHANFFGSKNISDKEMA